ncbi:3-deoxy-7-phosphoheptulonate synthase [Candidatus Hepatincolaceae symbiont of Richtersius coronifer]
MLNNFKYSRRSVSCNAVIQSPYYQPKDIENLENIKDILLDRAPLIKFKEVQEIKQQLGNLQANNSFILQIGECAETFDQANLEDVQSRLDLINNFKLILSKSGKKIITIGRIAGQYSKPRSLHFEQINGVEMPTYKGDMFNDFASTLTSRNISPNRLLSAYDHSQKTLELMNTTYKEVFTSHECLNLYYEKGLTRKISDYPLKAATYNSSAHMLWVGERTRQLDGPHLAYVKEIANPIGVKISSKITDKELIQLITLINPLNERGKIILISRMGVDYIKHLEALVKTVKYHSLKVIWMCDPMHGNTFIAHNNYKTRAMKSIIKEIEDFNQIIHKNQEYFGGIHLEATYQNVTECLANPLDDAASLQLNYLSRCDPRLNYDQSLEIANLINNLLTLNNYPNDRH